MKIRLLLTFLMLAVVATISRGQGLNLDFNSTTQDGGPHNNAGWSAYDAGHEVTADFVRMDYSAFGTTVGVTPAWPNTTDNRVQQMIDRGAANDANWTDDNLDGITDFLGIDTRVGNGGNGNWDGTTGDPTYLTLTLSDLPASTYNWQGFHHDTENVHVNFSVEVSTDGGATFAQLADGYMSDSTPGGNPDSATNGSPGLVTDLAGMAAVGSIYNASFVADGTNDVVVRYAPYSGALGDAVHNQIFGINGFSLNENAAITWGDVDSDTRAGDLIGGPSVLFTPGVYDGGNAEGTFFTGDGGDSGNEDLNAVYNSHGWNGAGASITLDGLTAGEDYMIQLLGAGDTRGCCATRTQAADDGVGNVSGDFGRGNTSVVGTFTATSSSQNVAVIAGTVDGVDPGLSGYILTDGAGNYIQAVNIAGSADVTVAVPEPASFTLIGFAGLMLMGLRRRS